MKTWLINLMLTLTAVFAPAKGMVMTALLLVVMDMVTGILASRKQKTPITSAGLGRSIVKTLVYEGAILLAFLTQQYLTGPEVPVSNIVAGLIGLTELKSVMENLSFIVSGGSLLSSIIDKLRKQKSEGIMKYIKSLLIIFALSNSACSSTESSDKYIRDLSIVMLVFDGQRTAVLWYPSLVPTELSLYPHCGSLFSVTE